jgi:DNA-directed RNA polymerase specialized sigma24 family protein
MTEAHLTKETSVRVREALENLTAVELLRLHKFAEWRIQALGRKRHGRTAEDLLHDAVVATIEGGRVWRDGIDLIQHLCGAMRSISCAWSHKRDEYLDSELAETDESFIESLAASDDFERSFAAQKEFEAIQALFAGDVVASKVLACFYFGYTPKERYRTFGLSAKDYEAGVRRIRRKLQASRDAKLESSELQKHQPEPVA